ncbi:response regulator transcription factor [Paenibacillus sp. JNUCC32]|uniref:response regulator n=1 Tax=Paenibacillus sp. JNUCC32 TaxID=2777984 RepID=UPI001788649A|nr:response regulator [Paenibacillus sp. JNUCC-32]QOT11653.1 response regulator transcription factor [Paenibacillus sp. JNUCC-32]
MYTILIVDDEPIVREGIRNRIQWSEHGYECIGDCENGRDALEAVTRHQPDVVLTDINMPYMDGLELSRHITERFPKTKIIILTGFDDFEYAQQAVKLQVTDFILKPVTAAELRDMLDKLKLEMDEERGHTEHLKRLKKQLNESLVLLRERFLERLASSPMKRSEMESRLAYFDIPLRGPLYIAMAADMDELRSDEQHADNELHAFALYNIMQEILAGEPGAAVFRYKENKVMTILSGSDEKDLYARAQELAEDIRGSTKQFMKFTVTVGIGTICRELQDIRYSCKASEAALEYRLLIGRDQVVHITDLEKRGSGPLLDGIETETALVSAIRAGTGSEVKACIRRLISELGSASISIELCYVRVLRVMLSVLQTLMEIGSNGNELIGKEKRLLSDLYSFRSLDEIESWLNEVCEQALRDVAKTRKDITRSQMLEAVDFIQRHYEDAELSIKTVCSRIFMSTSYFSALFKSHTGKTFVEYVTEVRMEKAKELLKHSLLKTYEIAAKTGYQDPQYFSVLFKKHTGDTPTEYRNKMASGGVQP